MLEKPDLPDKQLIHCLRDDYGVPAAEVTFLPLGADTNTAVYRIVAGDAAPYFLKLRSGAFDEAAVAIPRLLYDQGSRQVIAPLETRAQRLWTHTDGFTVVLYPFIEGLDGYERDLSDRQWVALGSALKDLHTAEVPRSLSRQIPRETYDPRLRDMVRGFLVQAEDAGFADPVAAEVAALLRNKRATIDDLVGRAERYGAALRARSFPYVLCHADIHAGNVLLTEDGALYIVDWDTLTYAPKEHDFTLIGGGAGAWHSARSEALVYEGYGPTEVDPLALAYYRYERIVADIAAFCEQLLLSDEGGADREQSLRYLVRSFQPDEVVAIAFASDAVSGTA